MTNVCGCDRPCREGFTLCTTDLPNRPSCKAELEQHLAEMHWLDAQLDISLTRTKGIAYNGASGKSSETPLPWNDRASRVRHELKAEMVLWVRLLRFGGDKWPDDQLPAMAAWLLVRLDLIAKHDDAWAIFDGITLASQKARAVVFAKPAERHFIGPCEGAIDDEGEVSEVPCDGDIYVTDGAALAECLSCKRAYDTDAAIRSRDEAMADRLLSLTEIADLAHHTFGQPRAKVLNTAKSWQKRGQIVAHQHVEGAARFRYKDVLDRLAQTYGDSA